MCWRLNRESTYIHTYTRLTPLFPGLPRWADTRKVKPVWILLKQETVSGCGISWAICKYAARSRQITTPAPHHSVFLQAGCPSCRPTNSVKALKATQRVPIWKRHLCTKTRPNLQPVNTLVTQLTLAADALLETERQLLTTKAATTDQHNRFSGQ